MASNDLDELVNNHPEAHPHPSSDFYPVPAFTGGFADSNDAFDTHNPFADYKPTTEFQPPSLSPAASSSTSAFLSLGQQDSKLYSTTSVNELDTDGGIPSYQSNNHFLSFDIPSLDQAPLDRNDLEYEGGFDEQKHILPQSTFAQFEPSDNGFADHHSTQLITNGFIPDDPAFQDQELLEHSRPPTPENISPISSSQARVFQETNNTPIASLPSKSPSSTGPTSTPAPLIEPAPFRPFGVTATLTSSTSDEVLDEPLNSSSLRSVNSSRPPLPDILGGGSLSTSVLLQDSRGALPAFKKSPRKTPKPASSIESKAAPRSPGSDTKTKEQTSTEAPRPYRPLGLKIAQAKPIIPIVVSEPPAPTPSTNTPSQLPAPKLAEPVLTTSSSSEQIPDTTTSTQTEHSPPVEASQNHVDVDSQPSSLESFTQNPSEPVNISSTPSPTDEIDVGPVVNSLASTHLESHEPEHTDVSDPKPPPGTGSNLSIIVPTRPSFLPSISDSARPTDRIETQETPDNVPKMTNSQQDVQVSASVTSENVVVPILNKLDQSAISAQNSKPPTDSDSEDERPLASVREGLFQQQVSGQAARRDPATGLTPATPAQIYFGSQDPLHNLSPPPPGPRYKCSVGDPQKMGMINDIHTVYTVKTTATDPSSSGPLKNSSTVLRRFRDFVWLFDTLITNNPGVIVPPIPDKNIRSRFQEGFIATRRVALEIFLQKTVNHPMLVSDPDLKLFLESDSFSLEIKHRKPDGSSQSGWLANIAGPRFHETDDFFDHRKASLDSLEAQLKTLHSSLSAASKDRRTFSQSLSELSQALLTLSTCDLSRPMRNALDRLAGLHRQCHIWSEEQSKQELEGITATVEAYSRLIGSVRLTFSSRIKSWEKWQASLSNLRKVQANHEKAKRYSNNEHSTGLRHSFTEVVEAERKAQDARNEFGDVSKLIKAEMQRFDKEKVEDFKSAICAYVDGVTERQRQIVHAWQEYYHLLQSLTKQNTEVLPQSVKTSQESETLEPEPIKDSDISRSVTSDMIKPIKTVSNSNGNEVTASLVEPSPWTDETFDQTHHNKSFTSPINNLPEAIFTESCVFNDS
ncbi:hypothetical protein CROQUDRAFT_721855 [Cronartium quercuum f. sp. fusiforme G11]|uniref:PX domain-containing protein n=1 Tax=Cronartium quercuum f. sp. fusiforme G11 TaxID=708437 RepID=A0A9P6NR83_9BASI|nr:hypothetical protein CROQUDRAFT_721855 [Cronartium quercuum f. sp. fusiforme G11]